MVYEIITYIFGYCKLYDKYFATNFRKAKVIIIKR